MGLLLQLSVGGVVVLAFRKKFVDGGWAFGRVVGWLVIGLVVWMMAHAGAGVNTKIGVILVGVGVIIGSGYLVVKKGRKVRKFWKERWRVILIEEVLFVVGLTWMILMRGYNPAILDLEKFMDAGFMNAYSHSPTLPASDIWLAGGMINYYSFGHFLGSVMMRLWGMRTAYGYNLLLGWLMGLVLAQVFSVVINVARVNKKGSQKLRFKEVFGSLVGSVLVVFGGNSHTAWYWFNHKGWEGYWYASATRFIPNTIHEFPAYSFVVSDLHAHLWGLPIVLLFLLLLAGWVKEIKKRKWQWAGGMGVVLGMMTMTNTWDVLVYGLLAGILGLMLWSSKKIGWKDLLVTIVIGLIGLVLVAMPWWKNFVPISQGMRMVEEHSQIKDLLILWTGHVFLSGLALVWAVGRKQKNWLVVAVVVTAWMLIVLPEFVYVKDIYPSHPRANTMFKLTYQALILMSIVIGVLITMLKKVKAKLVVGSLVVD